MKTEYGYMGKMLFVDLTNRKIHEEEIFFIQEGGEREGTGRIKS
jgi:hypothetical protein